MPRVLLDTNVLASAFANPGAPPATLLAAWLAGAFELVVSGHILNELERTLRKPYFLSRLGETQVQANLELLRRRATPAASTGRIRGVATHPADDRVLDTAVSASVDYLVTGDGAFRTQVGEYQGVKLVSPREFLELLSRAH